MCLHTTKCLCVFILLYVFSYCYTCVLILLCICPHTAIHARENSFIFRKKKLVTFKKKNRGSLFDALYGTDALSEDGGAARSSEYNPVCSLLYFILVFSCFSMFFFLARSRRHPLPLAGGKHFFYNCCAISCYLWSFF